MAETTEYAVIKSGGKQYRVKKGDIIDVELMGIEPKSTFECKEVLLYCNGTKTLIGAPFISKAIVKGEVLADVRGPKVIAYKYKKRKKFRRKVGHRQDYSRIKITDFLA
jgi:large subunit ribosomal protein L21